MANVKILVVENERRMAADLVSRLRTLGYPSSDMASSGEEALKKASESRPDLVLVDTQLKGGMGSLRTAKEIQDCFDIPVVYLADYIDDSTLLEAEVTEPFEYVLKPFMERELHKSIETVLYKHKMGTLRRVFGNGS